MRDFSCDRLFAQFAVLTLSEENIRIWIHPIKSIKTMSTIRTVALVCKMRQISDLGHEKDYSKYGNILPRHSPRMIFIYTTEASECLLAPSANDCQVGKGANCHTVNTILTLSYIVYSQHHLDSLLHSLQSIPS